MRCITSLIRLGVLSVSGFAVMAACGGGDEGGGSSGGSGGTGAIGSGGSDPIGGSGGTGGTGASVGDAGSDAPTGCKEGETQACYTGPPATQGIGECKDGITTCTNGIWSTCTGEVLPGSTELCDTLDNNCNGTKDEGCACTNGEQRDCYSGAKGTENNGICKKGIQTCENGAWGSTCAGEVVPKSESCNKIDDDCDGLVDNGNPDGGGTCDTGKQGICAAGTETCENGALVCKQNQQPKAEQCNNVDDDCDGTVDDGDPGGGGNCNTGLNGECSNGTEKCVNGSISCQQTVFTKTEICNNKDDDCDGSTDEGNPGGGGACTNTALQGECKIGVLNCTNGSLTCTQTVFPKAETCNGKDDNCNGAIDEGNPGGGGTCTVAGKLGECAKSTWTCSGGSLKCNQTKFPTTELCNNLDDNCNGIIDEWPACCPYVLSDDGCSFVYESTVGGVALVGQKKHLDPDGLGKRVDFMPMWVRLDRARVDGGRTRAKLLAAEDEIVYLDEAHLTVVEHPAGVEVFTSTSLSRRSFEAGADWDFVALSTADLRTPARATWNGRDITARISRNDDHAVPCDLATDNAYDLDFGPVRDRENARLVIEGWRLRLSRGSERDGDKARLAVKQADGSYRVVRELSAPRGDRKGLVFDLSNVETPTGRWQLRLFTGSPNAGQTQWFVDRVRLSESPPLPLSRYDLPAASAELSFSGAPTLPHSGNPMRPRLAIDDGRGALGDEHRTYGRFTRYGDVTELLAESNDMFAILRRGDAVVFEFDGVREPAVGMARSLFLHTDLVFKPRTLPGAVGTDRTTQVGPLPYHGMQRYGAGAIGAYPMDDAHRRYLAEYNTRSYGPRDRHWGSLGASAELRWRSKRAA